MAVDDYTSAPTLETGDDFHYASFYLAPARRTLCRTLEAWRREVAAIPQTCSDRGVAHLKLAWWREELGRYVAGEARHPLTIALATGISDTDQLSAALERFLDAVESSLFEPVLATREAVLTAIAAQHGELLAVYAHSGKALTDADLKRLLDLAYLSELAYELRGLRQHRRGGPLYLAADALAEHGLTVDDVRSATDSRALVAVLRSEMTAVLGLLEQQLAALPRGLGRRHSVFGAQARLVAAALRLTVADDCQVLERRLELLPAHKLMLAWRSRYVG